MNIPQDYFKAMIRHAVDLKRYENGLSEKINSALLDVEADILARLRRIDPPQGGRSAVEGPLSFKTRRLRAFLAEARTLLGETFDSGSELATGELRELAKTEVEFAAQQLERAVDGAVEVNIGEPIINDRFLRVVVDENPITGLPMTKWWDKLEAATGLEFERRLTVGLIQGETIDQLVARVRGTKTNGYNDGILRGGTRRGAEMLVRTAVNRVSNTALNETWKANGDITKKYRYMATLDGRTSKICIALDGKEWDYDDPEGRLPPQHPNCRSSHIPVIDWDGLGVKPRYRPDPGMRASQEGPVSADTTYGGWLKAQTAEFQDDVLGTTRGKFFRDGKIGVNDLVRSDNRTITLAELRKRNVDSLEQEFGFSSEGEKRFLRFTGTSREKREFAKALGFDAPEAIDSIIGHANKGIRDGVEYGSLMDRETGKILAQAKGTDSKVIFTKARKFLERNKTGEYTLLHNHTENLDWSAQDLWSLGTFKRGLVIGHNGRILKAEFTEAGLGMGDHKSLAYLIAERHRVINKILANKYGRVAERLTAQGMDESSARRIAFYQQSEQCIVRLMDEELEIGGAVIKVKDVLSYEEIAKGGDAGI